jgi:hypothetical protein
VFIQTEIVRQEKGYFAVYGTELNDGETRLADCEGNPRTVPRPDELCESGGDRQGTQQTHKTAAEQTQNPKTPLIRTLKAANHLIE